MSAEARATTIGGVFIADAGACMNRYLTIGAATVLSAVLWHLGGGLHPLPALAFLAPLPVLYLAPRISARAAFPAGALSWLGGVAQFYPYLTGTVEQPFVAAAALLGGTAVAYGALVLLTRTLLVRGRPGLAVLAFPAGWVTLEYLISVLGPFGAWWSIAYAQTDVLPLIQSAALTGPWGITFLILLAPTALAVFTAPNVTRAQRLRVGGGTVVVFVAVLGFGVFQLNRPADGGVVRVGLVAVAQPPEYVPVDTAAGREMIDRAVAAIDRLADAGAKVVVFPEKAWRADESTLPPLSGPLTDIARRHGIDVIAGLVLTRQGVSVNAAVDYPSGVVYAKHYLIPGLENELRAGNEWQSVPGTSWALAVCFDLDRPGLVRANQRRGATLMLAPALDFDVDHWVHSRMAVMRGVESGVGVARAAQRGELVASDSNGRVLGSAATDLGDTRTVLADIPLRTGGTMYARIGDWFAWLCALTLAVALLRLYPRSGRSGLPTGDLEPVGECQ